jgi:hypothetical protein
MTHHDASPLSRARLFAWCIASHDAAKRSPEQRAHMLRELGITRLAWGNRMAMASMIPLYEAEMNAMQAHGIEMIGRYLNSVFDEKELKPILDAIAARRSTPQLWVSEAAVPKEVTSHEQRLEYEINRLRPFAKLAADYGLKLGLYNHKGWFGTPDNLVLIVKALAAEGLSNVGLALCMHWAHGWLDEFEAVFDRVKPHLLALSLSGMTRGADANGPSIIPVGAGQEDLRIIRHIERSGWQGLVGVINHTEHDARLRLLDHLNGLDALQQSLRSAEPCSPPAFHTHAPTVA